MMQSETLHPEETWAPARLIPVMGMSGSKEQEERATAALLSVMQVVPSFGKAILAYLDAPAGHISCYTEPHFEMDEGDTAIPDGAVLVERGKTHWKCLVEVKTGSNDLSSEQIDRYLRVANREGFDALLTVSNQIVASPDEVPVRVDGRRLRAVKLRHLSWFRVLTEAVIQHEHHGVEDREQAKVLDDLVVFLDDERSGAGGYEGMGKTWVTVRDAARKRTLRPTDAGVAEVADCWEEFLEYLCLRLRQNLGHPVAPLYPRGSDARTRRKEYIETLGGQGRLQGSIRITDAVAPVQIDTDLERLQVTTRVRVAAPKEGRPKTRINWLLRQLKDVPPNLRVVVQYRHTRHSTSLLAEDARNRPGDLLLPEDPNRAPKSFDVALTRDMGTKRGKRTGSFVAETMKQVLDFYGSVVQDLRKWRPHPPKLPESAKEQAEEQPAEPVSGI
jgi:hypothetical protein